MTGIRQDHDVHTSLDVAAKPVALPKRPLWRRLLKWFLWAVASIVGLVVVLVLVVWWLWGSGRMLNFFMGQEAERVEKLAPTERPWPPPGTPPGAEPTDTWPGPRLALSEARSAAEFFRATNVWEVELRFTDREWKKIQQRPVAPAMPLGQPPEKFPLRNAAATRNGLAGVLGIEQPWSSAEVLVGGVAHTNVSVRFKGNGTFVGALATHKKPFKVDFSRKAGSRRIAGFPVLNLNNLNADHSCVSDAMAYAFYREAGVPAPRTAYARLLLDIEGKFRRRPMGLYVLVENLDGYWAREAFPGRDILLFKPVTYELFSDLGDNWSAYAGIYDPKTDPTEAQQRRVMETARFVTSATDAEFAAGVGQYFDLEEVARFVAVTSMLSSYDGFLVNGQNFLMYLDSGSGKFGFIPWDLDQAWGGFPLQGTRLQRETASYRRPWVADHRLLERLFAVETFDTLYRREYERIFRQHFLVPQLREQARRLARMVRPTVLEESDYRVDRFDQSHAEEWPDEEPEAVVSDPFRPAHRIHRFLVKRAETLEAQFSGKEPGYVFERRNLVDNNTPAEP